MAPRLGSGYIELSVKYSSGLDQVRSDLSRVEDESKKTSDRVSSHVAKAVEATKASTTESYAVMQKAHDDMEMAARRWGAAEEDALKKRASHFDHFAKEVATTEQYTAAMRKAGDLQGELAQKTQVFYQAQSQWVQSLGTGVKSVGQEFEKLHPHIMNAANRIGPALGDVIVKPFTFAIDHVKGMVAGLFDHIAGIAKGAAFGIAATITGAIGTAFYQGIKRLDTLEEIKLSMKYDKLSEAQINRVEEDMRVLAKRLAIPLNQVMTQAEVFTSAGVKPGQDLIRVMEDVSNVAAKSNGKLSAEMVSDTLLRFMEGNTQRASFMLQTWEQSGVDIIGWLAKQLGKSNDQIVDALQKGEISSAQVFRAIESNLNGFAERSGQTVAAKLGMVWERVANIGEAALKPFFGTAVGGFDKLIEKLDYFAKWLNEHQGDVVHFVGAIVTGFFDAGKAVTGFVASVLSGLGNAVHAVGTFMEAIGKKDAAESLYKAAGGIQAASDAVQRSQGWWQKQSDTMTGYFATLEGVTRLQQALAGATPEALANGGMTATGDPKQIEDAKKNLDELGVHYKALSDTQLEILPDTNKAKELIDDFRVSIGQKPLNMDIYLNLHPGEIAGAGGAGGYFSGKNSPPTAPSATGSADTGPGWLDRPFMIPGLGSFPAPSTLGKLGGKGVQVTGGLGTNNPVTNSIKEALPWILKASGWEISHLPDLIGMLSPKATGGITGSSLPSDATIQKPVGSGGLIQWAEPSTGGEAFIPIGKGNRERSLEIWRQTGKLLGVTPKQDGTIGDVGVGVDADPTKAVDTTSAFLDALKKAITPTNVTADTSKASEEYKKFADEVKNNPLMIPLGMAGFGGMGNFNIGAFTGAPGSGVSTGAGVASLNAAVAPGTGSGYNIVNWMKAMSGQYDATTGSGLTISADRNGPTGHGVEPGDRGHPKDTMWHDSNRAVDLAGTPAEQVAFAQWWASDPVRVASTLELINGQPGSPEIKNGQFHTFDAGLHAQHMDHVHLALQGVPASMGNGLDLGGLPSGIRGPGGGGGRPGGGMGGAGFSRSMGFGGIPQSPMLPGFGDDPNDTGGGGPSTPLPPDWTPPSIPGIDPNHANAPKEKKGKKGGNYQGDYADPNMSYLPDDLGYFDASLESFLAASPQITPQEAEQLRNKAQRIGELNQKLEQAKQRLQEARDSKNVKISTMQGLEARVTNLERDIQNAQEDLKIAEQDAMTPGKGKKGKKGHNKFWDQTLGEFVQGQMGQMSGVGDIGMGALKENMIPGFSDPTTWGVTQAASGILSWLGGIVPDPYAGGALGMAGAALGGSGSGMAQSMMRMLPYPFGSLEVGSPQDSPGSLYDPLLNGAGSGGAGLPIGAIQIPGLGNAMPGQPAAQGAPGTVVNDNSVHVNGDSATQVTQQTLATIDQKQAPIVRNAIPSGAPTPP